MNQRTLFSGLGLLVIVALSWGLWKSSSTSPDTKSGTPAIITARERPTTTDDSTPEAATTLLSRIRTPQDTDADIDEIRRLLADASDWSRKDLRLVLDELLGQNLSQPGAALAFGQLLSLYSMRDSEGALALYLRASRDAGFDSDGSFPLYEIVLGLADLDPWKAEQWLLDHGSGLPSPATTELMLEKVRAKKGG